MNLLTFYTHLEKTVILRKNEACTLEVHMLDKMKCKRHATILLMQKACLLIFMGYESCFLLLYIHYSIWTKLSSALNIVTLFTKCFNAGSLNIVTFTCKMKLHVPRYLWLNGLHMQEQERDCTTYFP